jgi:BirA family transcriptional regulator, biotin operon repressor / biotin---[acetyl-CoA-carboxylase] ligase
VSRLGRPHLHLRATGSTNDRARELAAGGAPHGTLVTASAQSAGRGRQGRTWSAPPGDALLLSLVLRELHPLLPLAAGLAVARVAGGQVKWPNDVLLDGRKVAGTLAEGRPQEGWAILGIGLNVAVRPGDLPPDVAARAATLGRPRTDIPVVLRELLAELERALALPHAALLDELRARDALLGAPVTWSGGAGTGAGIDDDGRLLVRTAGGVVALDAGEVHLGGG